MKKPLLISALVLFCIAVSQNAYAGSHLGWRSIGVDVGFVDPENVDGAFGFGAFADLGTLAPSLHLAPQLAYWSKSEEDFGAEASVGDLSLGARAKYMFHVSSRTFQPYAGGGLGLHFVSAKVTIPDPFLGGFMTLEDNSTKLGLDMGGGFVTPIGAKTDLTGDLWYTFVEDVSHLSMKVGIAMKLGR
ncbi:MAG: outer membrane beta-barrel protein [Candidatus Latescibacteria bacterium]|nr:outer membrane beta-barrel protein [Candidatus Latescibacterota bacterium]